MKSIQAIALSLTALFGASCASLDLGPKVTEILSVPEGEPVALEDVAAELRRADVIFLGEYHDSLEGHEVMTALTALILEGHPAAILSMEMFERDVQDIVTAYVDGRIDEATFLASARPWGTHAEMYAPAVDMARERGWSVLAANAPRPAASAIARHGFKPTEASIFASTSIDTSDSEYRRRFLEEVGDTSGHGTSGHGMSMTPENMYAAQVLKDETMAASIARVFANDSGRWPRVVHWCGRFHSDWGLGTVERLVRRRPDLRIAIVSMERGHAAVELARSADAPASYIIRVP